MNKDIPAEKLTRQNLDHFAEDFEKHIIPAEKLNIFLTELYDRFRINSYEGTIMGKIVDMDCLKKSYDEQLKQLGYLPEFLNDARRVANNTEMIKYYEAHGHEVPKKLREKAVNDAITIKSNHDAMYPLWLELKHKGEKVLEEMAELSRQTRKAILGHRIFFWLLKLRLFIVRIFATFLIIAINFMLAWYVDMLSETTERSRFLEINLPEFFHRHIYFFAVFFILELLLDPFKDKLKEKFQRAVILNRFHKLKILHTLFEQGRLAFCKLRGISPEILDQILMDRLYAPSTPNSPHSLKSPNLRPAEN